MAASWRYNSLRWEIKKRVLERGLVSEEEYNVVLDDMQKRAMLRHSHEQPGLRLWQVDKWLWDRFFDGPLDGRFVIPAPGPMPISGRLAGENSVKATSGVPIVDPKDSSEVPMLNHGVQHHHIARLVNPIRDRSKMTRGNGRADGDEIKIKKEDEGMAMEISAMHNPTGVSNAKAAQQQADEGDELNIKQEADLTIDIKEEYAASESDEERAPMPTKDGNSRPPKKGNVPMDQAICGNPFCLSKKGHRVSDCTAVDQHGVFNGCPWCNEPHEWWLCAKLSQVTLSKLFYFLVTRRNGKPQIRSPVNVWDIWAERWQDGKARPQTVEFSKNRALHFNRFQTLGKVTKDPFWHSDSNYADQFRDSEGLNMEKDILPKLRQKSETPAVPNIIRESSATRLGDVPPPQAPMGPSRAPTNAPSGPRIVTPSRGHRAPSVSSRYSGSSSTGYRSDGKQRDSSVQYGGYGGYGNNQGSAAISYGNENRGGSSYGNHQGGATNSGGNGDQRGFSYGDYQGKSYNGSQHGNSANLQAPITASAPGQFSLHLLDKDTMDYLKQDTDAFRALLTPRPQASQQSRATDGPSLVSHRDQAREHNQQRRRGKDDYRRGRGRNGRGGSHSGGGNRGGNRGAGGNGDTEMA